MIDLYGRDEVVACSVISFSAGSIVANVQLEQRFGSTTSNEQLQSDLLAAINTTGGVIPGSAFTVDSSSVIVQGI